MSRRIVRTAALVAVLALGAAACSNSSNDAKTSSTSGSSASTSASSSSSGDAQRNTHETITGVPGVTDTTITYDVIGSKANNPLGTCILDCYAAGVKAYFAFRNSEGGVYGRQLTVGNVTDDEVTSNQPRALDLISANSAFGDFNATLFASGWGDLAGAGVPTYVWAINPEANNHPEIFGNAPATCYTCTGRGVPYIASLAHATKAASLGYGVTENSKQCADATAASFKKYEADTHVAMAYENNNLDFGLANGIAPQVTEMKNAGVDFISTCFDLNGMKTLAQELQKQGMDNVVLYHPNTYDQKFVKDNASLFEGDYVRVGFTPFEAAGSAGLTNFLKWMQSTGAEPTELAMDGWINADEAFTGLLKAGPQFDRKKVIDGLNTVTAYTADGLLQPIDWTRQHVPPTPGDLSHDYKQECVAAVKIVSGVFQTVAPKDKPWECWDNSNDNWGTPTPTSFN